MASGEDAVGDSVTMQLLSKYNDHISERDESLAEFERKEDESSQPSYDELLKENVKLRLQLQESETELISLRKFVEVLKSDRSVQFESVRQQLVVEEDAPKEPVLPPRSAERKRNAKNLSLNSASDSAISEPKSRNLLSPADIGLRKNISNSYNTPVLQQPVAQEHVLSPKELDRIRRSSSSYSNVVAASPATSVAYTTSRISPSKSNKHDAKDDESASAAVEKGAAMRQYVKGISGSTSEGFNSPLRQVSSSNSHQNLSEHSSRKAYPKSPVPNLLATEEKAADFSPSSKRNFNNFVEMLDSSFETEDPSSSQTRRLDQQSGSRALGSPVTLRKAPNSPQLEQSPRNSIRPSNASIEGRSFATTVPSSVASQNISSQDQQSPRSFSTKSFPTVSGDTNSITIQSTNNTSTPSVTDTQSVVSDIPLFLQPNELNTIRIEIISTLHRDQDRFCDDNFILFSVIDKQSAKDIFRFAKTIDRVYELDVYLKCHMDTIMLPPLPEKQLFESNSPVKIDYRREKLNDYFNCLYGSSNVLPIVALKMAKFISTGTVMNSIIGEYAKEGVLLMRKSKALGTPNNWRLTYAVLNGGILSLLDRGQISESIKVHNAVIELQANLPDDRYGTKNGFIVIVPKKSGLSSGTKYYFCCESPKEREAWVSNLTEFVEAPILSNSSTYTKSENSSMLEHYSASNDVPSDSTSSYIGPMANLQPPANVLPASNADAVPTDDERETKRSRMRSFFPFKRVNVSQIPTDSDLNTDGSVSEELSIAKTLHSMDLADEVSTNKIFGSDLNKCLSLSSQLYQGEYKIPSVVYRCLEYLYRNHGIEEEGIFRISGSTVLIKSLQEQFDREHDVDLCNFNKTVVTEETQNSYSTGLVDVNTVTGLLKLYLRQMPHSIFGERMFSAFKDVIEFKGITPSQIAVEFRRLVHSDEMPFENLSLMFVLFELLVKINQKSSFNKMNLRNLCIVFSPTLNIPVNVIQPFVVDFNCIFENKDPISDSSREQLIVSIPQM
ncbi:LAME_0H13234g1_1 [Lachancea meyersii CBS 8951]|uniref:LAME_0H13234g1_1 n=1 Tax=Lachancea meyersii CBS 8951 TaxID=1266667 RepID=A0A1G4KGU0_9SACH|nr:LAME_0H13234g1_1 [Lachancea meyersii CBS 8951]